MADLTLPAYTPRRSLHSIGIPDAHDALAIYLRWVRQAQYLRNQSGPELSSSVGSAAASDTLPPPSTIPALSQDAQFDVVSLAHDLLCVGARFDEPAPGARVAGYARELDILD